ncbi:MAG: deoxyguanosinetriphosphate triphosphohydrolase [Hyphomicrobiaceae bacterium]
MPPAANREPDAPGGYGAELVPGERSLATYAASAIPSRGRLVPESPCPTRNNVQRDRDRVLHSTAFRRLIYKTQMFLYHEGDHYRTRLTHSLEVAQIARAIARQLRLDEDLAEALALAHDLGHPPFGHAGERALDQILAPCGGFDHNVQSFRIVTLLERKYAAFDGLNLSWETLEGLIKHNGPPRRSGEDGDRRLLHALRRFEARMSLNLDQHGSAEAQTAAIADDIAWMTHDIDDGLRAGLIGVGDLADVPLLRETIDDIEKRGEAWHLSPVADDSDTSRGIYEVVRRLITDLIRDVVVQTRRNLAALAPRTAGDIRQAGYTLVTFSDGMAVQIADLRRFLFARLYRHQRVMRVMGDAQEVVRGLVERYVAEPGKLPPAWQAQAAPLDERRRLRLIGDFVAGMTDRYAIGEHRRLFATTPELR